MFGNWWNGKKITERYEMRSEGTVEFKLLELQQKVASKENCEQPAGFKIDRAYYVMNRMESCA